MSIVRKLIRTSHAVNLSTRCLVDSLHPSGKRVSIGDKVILNTSIGSDNSGDDIIMHFAKKQLASIFPIAEIEEYPTHGGWVQMDNSKSQYLKIICGTNAISTKVTVDCPIAFPKNVSLYRNSILLMAAGLRCMHGRRTISSLSSRILHYALSDQVVHSVRDEKTEAQLKAIGISNVLNTSCVTMWGLTPEACSRIPREKADYVLTTVTDYARNQSRDKYMLETLLKKYKKVYLWLQGVGDRQYINSLVASNRLDFIDGKFESLKSFVENGDFPFDYFGTRLHCGIYCLNMGIRSMIVGVDNRALDIKDSTNLPVIHRDALPDAMERLVDEARATDIHIPVDSIRQWKRQFL